MQHAPRIAIARIEPPNTTTPGSPLTRDERIRVHIRAYNTYVAPSPLYTVQWHSLFAGVADVAIRELTRTVISYRESANTINAEVSR